MPDTHPRTIPTKNSLGEIGPPRHPDEYSKVMAQAVPSNNFMSSYAPKPEGFRFEGQDHHEQILLYLRQHPIVLLPWLAIGLFMALAPVLFFPLFPFLAFLPANFKFVLLLSWYLLTVGFLFERTLMWLFNSFIITDERIVDIDFYSLIYKELNFAQIDKIQDTSYKTGGVLFSLLDVGTIFVQTAAEVPEFVFENISHPARVVQLLNELIIEEEREKNEGRVR
jgi:hypothetical protein